MYHLKRDFENFVVCFGTVFYLKTKLLPVAYATMANSIKKTLLDILLHIQTWSEFWTAYDWNLYRLVPAADLFFVFDKNVFV